MKKSIAIVLAVSLLELAVPLGFVAAITQNQINAAVQIVCPDSYDNWFSGTGTIIDSKGIILTNKHVVTDIKGGIINTCFICFVDSISSEPNFGTESNPNLAEVKYYTTSADMDAALLYLNNPTNKVYPYVDIWGSNSSGLKFGDKIEVVGYPSIGGSTITYTSGDFSGFGGSSDGTQNYIKASVPLEHGNSGGAAYGPGGLFIGIPSMVIAGRLNSMGYIFSVDSIKQWLSNILGTNYSQSVTKLSPSIVTPSVNVQPDKTPPDISKIDINFYDCSKYFPRRDSGGTVQHFPTVNGVDLYFDTAQEIMKPEMCNLVPRKTGPHSADPQTLYVKFIMPTDVASDIYTVGTWWDTEPLVDPLKIQPIAPGTAFVTFGKYYFEKPYPNINSGEGKYYYALQVADRAGNISDTKTWVYEYGTTTAVDSTLVQKLKGYILLQVESYGKAWYVNSADGKRYYMKDGPIAYEMMRRFSLGITNANLARLPQEGENKAYPTALNSLKGKILLQVEAHGEAWYVHPKTGIRYYMKDGEAAYTLMRYHSLGITNSDLEKIPEGSLQRVGQNGTRYFGLPHLLNNLILLG